MRISHFKTYLIFALLALILSGCAVIDVVDCVDPFRGSCTGLHKRIDPDYEPKLKPRKKHVSYEAYKNDRYKESPIKKPSKTWGGKD